METSQWGRHFSGKYLFKSYYVVWKQEKSVDEVEIIERLNRTMQYGNTFSQTNGARVSETFKSYYVVWKHKCTSIIQEPPKRLNRTMQYGNPRVLK